MIRLLEEKDIEKVLEILLQVHDVHVQIRPDIFKPNSTKYDYKDILRFVTDRNNRVYVYEKENEIVGYIFTKNIIYEETPSTFKRKVLYIDDLCVEKNHRRNGVATSLYNYVKSIAINEKFDSIEFNVWSGNNSAKAFYNSLGMKEKKAIMEEKIS